MLFWILVVLAGAIFWKSGSAKTKKAIVYTVAGLALVTFVHTAIQFNTWQNSSVLIQSESVSEGDMSDHKHEKQSYVP